jgi:tetratricopeptide (TPR) repeat protein
MAISAWSEGAIMIKKIALAVGILVVLGALGTYFGVQQWVAKQLQEAESAMQSGDFGKSRLLARQVSQWAMDTQQRDRSRLLLSRAMLADETLDDEALEEAFGILETIDGSSPVYVDVLVTKARQEFFGRLKVRSAEKMLEQALALRPNHVEANQILFSIYTATNRADRADPVFWKVFPDADPLEKPQLFRLWFLSQFTRNGANRAFDIGSGIVPPTRPPSDDDVIDRFIVFKNQEPKEAMHYGTMASWWLWKTETKTALEILQVGQRDADNILEEVYLSSLVQTLLNQGEFAQAEQLLAQWPEEQRGYNYWRHLAVCQQSTNQVEAAAETYQRCFAIWPGPIDSNVSFRLQECLKELGKDQEAEKVGAQTEVLRQWLEERWGGVRQAIDYLHDRQAVGILIEFFTAIGKPEAVDFLQAHLGELQKAQDAAAAKQ